MEKDVTIQELEGRIKSLRASQLDELQDKLKEARQVVAELEAELAKITGKAPAIVSIRRKRTSSEDVRSGILKALASSPQGLSKKQISDITELNYNTVVLYLKSHKKDFKSTGSQRAMRFFLK